MADSGNNTKSRNGPGASKGITDSNDRNGTVRLSGLLSVALMAAGILVSGCSLINDRSDDYVTAQAGKPLKGIDGEPLPRQRPAFPVRDVAGGSTLGSQIPEPPDLTSEILDQNYVVESLDDQSWLLVNEVPGQVWPAVNVWMTERGLGVANDSTQLGLLQSEIINFSQRARTLVGLDQADDNESLMLLQARLAPGVRRKTTEIQVRPRVVSQAPGQLLPWQDTPMDQDLEEQLLADLSEFLQGREDSRSYSRAALAMSSTPKVTLREASADQDRAIVIALPYDRAWGEIRRVLEDEGIPVLDLDQSAGYFLVDGRPADERERSWLTSWFAGDQIKPVVTNRIRLSSEGDNVIVTAEKADEFDGGDYSRSVLTRLYEYLY